MAIVSVRLEKIKYGGWEELEVAIDINSTEYLYLTYPAAETILNYRENNIRKKIASKSLKAFLGAGRTVGKFTGNIVNKPELVGATAKVALILNFQLARRQKAGFLSLTSATIEEHRKAQTFGALSPFTKQRNYV